MARWANRAQAFRNHRSLPEWRACPSSFAGTDLHIGILFAVAAVIFIHLLFWKTSFGFRLRILGPAPRPRFMWACLWHAASWRLMPCRWPCRSCGAIEVLGVHLRLIEGFSAGLASVLLPSPFWPRSIRWLYCRRIVSWHAGTGSLAMQREVGVPSSLVFIIQGLTMIFVLAALGVSRARGGPEHGHIHPSRHPLATIRIATPLCSRRWAD